MAVRSSSVKLTPAISSAAAIVSLVISAPRGCCCACAQRTPGKSVDPSPIELKYAMNALRSYVVESVMVGEGRLNRRFENWPRELRWGQQRGKGCVWWPRQAHCTRALGPTT